MIAVWSGSFRESNAMWTSNARTKATACGAGAVRCVFMEGKDSTAPGAVIKGFTITGGYTFKDIVYENGEFSYKGPMDSLGKTVLEALDAVFGNLVSLVLP